MHAPEDRTARNHALCEAAGRGDRSGVQALLDQWADENARADGATPLILAARNGHVDVVRLLLTRTHLDVSLKDDGGRTALDWAERSGHKAVARLLKRAHLRDWLSLKFGGRELRDEEFREIVRRHLARGRDVNAIPARHRRPLLIEAAKRRDLVAVRLLLERGADANRQGEFGATALGYAVWYGQTEMVTLLRAAGAKVYLSAAVRLGELETARALLEARDYQVGTRDVTPPKRWWERRNYVSV